MSIIVNNEPKQESMMHLRNFDLVQSKTSKSGPTLHAVGWNITKKHNKLEDNTPPVPEKVNVRNLRSFIALCDTEEPTALNPQERPLRTCPALSKKFDRRREGSTYPRRTAEGKGVPSIRLILLNVTLGKTCYDSFKSIHEV